MIVTGKGRGDYTEAEVMHQYLVNEGIEAERIYQRGSRTKYKGKFYFFQRDHPRRKFVRSNTIRNEQLPSDALLHVCRAKWN
ncbi:hypothetical protein GH741_12995 [Aquibacillus halophilus]|uniref:Uncharacterized protein n=1 Tax=Aquibacillus halophilus TaxID=930132 RepID=A0A6A8DD43_9BACI|nr:hypothetical protein [Aquibacillus halophilus]